MATFNTDVVIPSNPVVFNRTILNPGGHYDATSGIYTAPFDGTYEFGVHVLGLDNYYDVLLLVDGLYVRIQAMPIDN